MTRTTSAQNENAKSLTKSDVVLDISRPSIFSCFENADKHSVWIRITNNSVWTLQFPATSDGTPKVLRKLSNGRVVAMLSNGATFYPGYGQESNSVQVIRPISIHVGTSSFLPSNSSAIFSIPGKVKEGRLYLDFNYEWELNTVYQATPTHRLYVDLTKKHREDLLCSNVYGKATKSDEQQR